MCAYNFGVTVFAHPTELLKYPSIVFRPFSKSKFTVLGTKRPQELGGIHVGFGPANQRAHTARAITVEPGFGGQKFMEDMMPKVKEVFYSGVRLLLVCSFYKHILNHLYI